MPEPPDPLDLAARALRHRDRSAHDIDARLEQAGVDAEARAEALERLAGLGYVDDTRFATARAETLAGRGHGDGAIRFDLERHGVDAETADAAVAALEPEIDRARALVARDGPTARTARRLAAKGFAAETIGHAIGADVSSEGAEAV